MSLVRPHRRPFSWEILTALAAVITNSIEAIVLALATASIGGIYTTTAPDMGVKVFIHFYLFSLEVTERLNLHTNREF